MTDPIKNRTQGDMEIVKKYANEAGQTLKNFSKKVMTESEQNYNVLCKMDQSKKSE